MISRRRWSGGRLVLAGLGAAWLAGCPGGATPSSASPPPAEVNEVPLDAATRLSRALALRRGAREDGEEALLRAVEALRAVRERHPAARRLGAEAAFRAGELLRAAGRPELASHEFGAAARLGSGTDWEARGLLEIGHVHRRARRHEEALTAFERVAWGARHERRRRRDATYWIGRVQEDRGRHDEARRAWERVARDAEDPLARIRAYDRLAGSLLGAGRVEDARKTVENCRRALSERAAEVTETGRRVRRALRHMHSARRLERLAKASSAGVELVENTH